MLNCPNPSSGFFTSSSEGSEDEGTEEKMFDNIKPTVGPRRRIVEKDGTVNVISRPKGAWGRLFDYSRFPKITISLLSNLLHFSGCCKWSG